MIFHVPQLIVEISKIFTLEAGDLILTGTPEGVGPIQVQWCNLRIRRRSDVEHMDLFFRPLGLWCFKLKTYPELDGIPVESQFLQLDLCATGFGRFGCITMRSYPERKRQRERERAPAIRMYLVRVVPKMFIFHPKKLGSIMDHPIIPGWFGTWIVFFHSVGNNHHPNWRVLTCFSPGRSKITHQGESQSQPVPSPVHLQAGDLVRAGIVGMSESEIHFDVAMDE